MRSRIVYGIATNDAGYVVTGCIYYNTWKNMFRRCYSDSEDNQTYKGCTVCPEWLVFSNFKGWMSNQRWEGMCLEKDILFRKNKLYSPQTCRFVPREVNNALLTRESKRGSYPLGVSKDKSKFGAYGKDSKNKTILLGLFNTPLDAHLAWQLYKIDKLEKLVTSYAKSDVFDTEIADALLDRMWCLKISHKNRQEVLGL